MAILRRAPFSLARPRRCSSRSYHATAPNAARLTIGIRREDPLRIWERRCPLTPDAVHDLVHNDGVDVLVQDCNRRVWGINEFVKAGARPHPTLAPAHIILGIKETPLPEVLTDALPAPSVAPGAPLQPRTHIMFSHTHKGQMYNMELLSKFVCPSVVGDAAAPRPELLPTLIDYELLTGEDGKRTVGFGWFAGVAGTLESLNALAHAHLELGVASPFLYTPRPHTHPSLASIRGTLRDVVGARIAAEGTPKCLGPIVLGVTGAGKVADGVLDILKELPIQRVEVEDLPALVSDPGTDLRKIYVVHALPADYFVQRDGRPYDRARYYANPQEYESVFHTKIAPYLSLLLHGAGWAPSFPRLMTNEQLTTTLEKAQQIGMGRFACVGDISCDVEGGLEFLPRHSTLSAPFFATRPSTLPAHLPPVTMMAVDILPTALPLEASQHFSSVLLPYLRALVRQTRPGGQKQDEREHARREALRRATVAQGGRLAGEFAWLEQPMKVWSAGTAGAKPESLGQPKKKVLMLGSGMVAGPAIEEICKRPDVQLLVASNSLVEAERQTAPYPNADPVLIDMKDTDKMRELIGKADVVISLLPVPFHPAVAELCIHQRKHLVTASYISPAMRALRERAVSADVVLLNEIGLDPGIDHCSAMSLISSLRAQKKEIVSFTSFCGGLPAPEHADNIPLGYKFSWSPKGVLTAASNDAKFKLRGKVVEIEGEELLQEFVPDLPISNVLKFEGIANRDSLPYADVYGLQPLSGIRTLFRGTLRYPGFCNLMSMFKTIGLLETSPPFSVDRWTSLARRSLEAKLGTPLKDSASFFSVLGDIVPPSQKDELLNALRWLSLIPSSARSTGVEALPPLPGKPAAPIDLFATLLAHKLRYLPYERDLVVLAHEIIARPTGSPAAGGTHEEVHTSSLVAYGTPKASAMSRTVGLPVAFAALQVLDGGVTLRGVQGPTHSEIYGNVLARLGEAGLGMTETVRRRDARTVEQRLETHWLSGL
ncbi:predicted protein [Sparassis crispa]|uniref:Alanine dehydrogenase/pyridine nucleotide transhydrogenase N-terminal domain-containing protein n=1 Tax=Sparassis crispa TaxID=139825 RepID=A0A401GU60_9APHY|nr:predicted protein [Sparassis crispa]GBE85762.1 predicted protein [Sparassis crispa]